MTKHTDAEIYSVLSIALEQPDTARKVFDRFNAHEIVRNMVIDWPAKAPIEVQFSYMQKVLAVMDGNLQARGEA